MALTVTAGVFIQYTPGMPYAGLWSAEVRGDGDASGGSLTLEVIPGSPFSRIFRIDNVMGLWEAEASAAALTDVYQLPHIDPEGTIETFSEESSNATVHGTQQMPMQNPIYWNSHNEGQTMIRRISPVLEFQNVVLRAWGVFYEPPVGRMRLLPELGQRFQTT